jgi:PBSX family phage terminase large subunit
MAYVIPARLRAVINKPGLAVILGVSRDTIERNVLEPMREIYTNSVVSRINGRNQAYICGEWVYCLGAEKVSQVAKIQGSSIKYAYGDEVAKWNPEVFAMLQSRLDKEYSCFDGSLNPEYPNHWLKEFLDRSDLDAYIQEYTIDDNPFLPESYVDALKKEYAGTVYYDRYILGKWALAEGLIYPMYHNALVDSVPDEAADYEPEYCISMDYGTMNAFAMLFWEKHSDGIWYATRRYYYSGRDEGVQKTDGEYLRDIETVIFDLIDRWRDINEQIAKNNPYGSQLSRIPVIIDPSAASFIALLKKTDWAKVIPADNAVADGIRETAGAMQFNKIKILNSIPE